MEKMLCIKITETKQILRVRESVANHEVSEGRATYTSKAAWRRYWASMKTVISNSQYLEQFDFTKKQKANFITTDSKGKIYAYLLRRMKTEIIKITPPETRRTLLGNHIKEEPKVTYKEIPIYQMFLLEDRL